MNYLLIFLEILNKLIQYNIIGTKVASDLFKPIRFQYQKLLHAIFNQFQYLPAQIVEKGSRSSRNKLQRSVSNDTDSRHWDVMPVEENNSDSLLKRQYMFSRYLSDFIEIEKLASGGFGSVFKVSLVKENCVDCVT